MTDMTDTTDKPKRARAKVNGADAIDLRRETPADWNAKELYDVYNVEIRMRQFICGGMPRNAELLKSWIVAKTEHDDETTDEQEKEAREALLKPSEEKSWNTFPADGEGLFIWTRQVKALFKECATMLRITTQKIGSKQILQHGFEIKGPYREDRIYLHNVDGSRKQQPDTMLEGPIHVQTAQGPRTAIKRVDVCERPVLTFAVWVLKTEAAEKRHLGEKELRLMLTFGQENGLGADRSQGHGKFNVVSFVKQE